MEFIERSRGAELRTVVDSNKYIFSGGPWITSNDSFLNGFSFLVLFLPGSFSRGWVLSFIVKLRMRGDGDGSSNRGKIPVHS